MHLGFLATARTSSSGLYANGSRNLLMDITSKRDFAVARSRLSVGKSI